MNRAILASQTITAIVRDDSSWYLEGFLGRVVPEWKLCRERPVSGRGSGAEGGPSVNL